jgi:hypothetical protein
MALPEPSEEQQQIVKKIAKNNIIVNAVAGSGKTTTMLFIAKEYPDKNILVLTYNKRLRFETRQRVDKANIKNVNVHNYHSFCCTRYFMSGYTDDIIIDSLDKYKSSKTQQPSFCYDIIVIDEAQDLTPLYFRLIKLIIKQCVKQPILCVIGDTMQTIYQFNGADSRFITMASELFPSSKKWINLSLTTSYRLSVNVCNFINFCVHKRDVSNPLIRAGNITKESPKGARPRYIFCNAFDTCLAKELTHHYLGKDKFGYKYDDIFILAPSIQSELSPIKMFANNISTNYNIPIFIPSSDTEKLDINEIKNKVVFATFHQVKGLQRKCIIVFGFDNSYFYYYNCDGDKTHCSPEIHVALTRTMERLTVIHHFKKNFIDFIDNTLISKYCYVEKIGNTDLNTQWFLNRYDDSILNMRLFTKLQVEDEISGETTVMRAIDKIMDLNNTDNSLDKNIKLSVTRLISRLSQETINECLDMVTITAIKNKIDTTDDMVLYDEDKMLEANTRYENRRKDDFLITMTNKTNKVSDSQMNVFTKSLTGEIFNNEENVSDIIGTAIPIIYEYKKTDKIRLKRDVFELLQRYNYNDMYKGIRNQFNALRKLKTYTNKQIFELVTIHLALSNNLIYKVNQMTSYNLLSAKTVNLCMRRLDNNITTDVNPIFESYFSKEIEVEVDGYEQPIKRIIHGYVDCIDENSLWEFKTSQTLTQLHILQLVVYMYLYSYSFMVKRKYYILSISSGEKYELQCSKSSLENIINILMQAKFMKRIRLSDDEFIYENS